MVPFALFRNREVGLKLSVCNSLFGISLLQERLDELYHIFIQERDAQLGESQPNVLDYMQLKDQVHCLQREYKKWTNKVCSARPTV